MARRQKNAPVDTLIRVGRQGAKYQQKAIADTPRASGYTQEYQEEEYEVVIDKSAAEILDEINKRVKTPYYSAFIGIPTLICGISTLLQPLLAVLFIPGSIATYLVYKRDVIRKTTPLLYEFDDEYSRHKFTEFSELIRNLSSAKNVWRLKSQIAIDDWKRNAGANSLVVRQHSKVGQTAPNLLKTNVDVWGIDSGSIKLYLLPDMIFVFQNGVYSTITYDELQIAFDDFEYTEHETLPQDATVIGQSWKFVRRDGEADRRFNNNRQLPIVRYGLVQLSTQIFVLYLIVSSLRVASSFTHSLSSLLSSPQSIPPQMKVPLERNNIAEMESSLPEHLDILENAAAQAKQLTTSQIAQLLGISKSSVTKNQESFEYEGFRFSRAGRIGRELAWQVTKLKK
jgi:hypothetical protein